jgi:CRP/FNR family transcriptional regulator
MILAAMRAIPTLASLSTEDQSALAPLCQIQGYDRNDTIFREGDPSERIFFIYMGRVKIVKSAGEREIILEILDRGEPVGAVAAYEGRPYPATAVTLEPSSVLTISQAAFFRLLADRPEVVRRILSGLTMRLMALNKRMLAMTGSIEQKIARLFLTLGERLGTADGDAVVIPMALSRQEIADLVGTTVESAIRLMSRWSKDGLLLTEKDGFRIPDRKALRRIAES